MVKFRPRQLNYFKVIELEQQGAELFFGEKSFEIDDLMRFDENGKGYINILRLTDIQDKPKFFRHLC
jgi:hypothetical protein